MVAITVIILAHGKSLAVNIDILESSTHKP